MLVPKLRFKRENGTDYPDWNYARTDEIAEINPKTSALPNRFYYMDLGSVSMGVWQEKTITDKDNAPSRANRLASVGDVFFQSVRPYNMGHFFFEEEYDFPVVASTGFIQLRATQGYYKGFIYQLLYEDRFNSEVNIRCTGSNYPAINSENFSDIEMPFPCLEEQQKIADFLSAVDEVIAQSQAEVQNLEQQKKAAMQKIFSQEVRFKREDGTEYPDWEEKNLSDICESIVGGGTPTTENKEYWNGSIAWVSSSDLQNDNIHYLSITRFITEDAISHSATKLIPQNSVLIVSRVGVGKVVIAPCQLCTSQDFTNLVNPQCNSVFLAYLLSVIMQKKASDVQGTSIKGITAKEIKMYDVSIPCLEEQRKIADFLSAYDEAITYAKQELEHWKQLKKGLLQQMFV